MKTERSVYAVLKCYIYIAVFSLQNSQKYPTITLSKHSEVHVSEVITCHHVAMRRRNCVFCVEAAFLLRFGALNFETIRKAPERKIH